MGRPKLSEIVGQLQERMTRVETALELSQISTPGVKRMLTTEEAASFLGMTVDGLRGLTYKKLIPFYKPNGKNMYFDVDELVAWQKKNHFEPIGKNVENPSGSACGARA